MCAIKTSMYIQMPPSGFVDSKVYKGLQFCLCIKRADVESFFSGNECHKYAGIRSNISLSSPGVVENGCLEQLR